MGKTVLVSGGTGGFGKGFVVRLLERGFRVATFSRDAEKGETLENELSEKFGRENFLVLAGDVASEDSLTQVVEKTLAKFGSIEILINNAGFGYFSDCDTADFSVFREMIETNLVGAAFLTKLVVPQMNDRKAGQIINIVSISGKTTYARGEFYSATKFGLMGYSSGVSQELKPFGIKVCTILPGMSRTEFFTKEELARRGNPNLLEAEDVVRTLELVCTQSERSDIQEIVVLPV
jgi:short-subunit dehydrogenase